MDVSWVKSNRGAKEIVWKKCCNQSHATAKLSLTLILITKFSKFMFTGITTHQFYTYLFFPDSLVKTEQTLKKCLSCDKCISVRKKNTEKCFQFRKFYVQRTTRAHIPIFCCTKNVNIIKYMSANTHLR